MLHTVIPRINTEVLLKESVFAIYYLLQEAFRDAMTVHSAQLTKMRLPDRAIMLKAVSKAKNPILVKRKKMFKLGLVRDSLFCFVFSVCGSLYLCSTLNPRLFATRLLKVTICQKWNKSFNSANVTETGKSTKTLLHPKRRYPIFWSSIYSSATDFFSY